MYPKITPKRLSGNEKLTLSNGDNIATLNEFWSWAYSDLSGNSVRGVLAEFIVGCALELKNTDRILWDKYDLVTKEGITVEVKSSGYLQTWHQKNLSKLVFGIRPTYAWDDETNTYDNSQKRQADVYVFCVHKHKEQETINPLLVSQWDFYLMPSVLLNKKFGNQKSATLSSLIKAGAVKCEYENIYYEIKKMNITD